MNERLVSILIPCYNYGAYLGEAIDSALAQLHPDIEIVVLDDGSTDNTPDVAAQYGSRISYHRTRNQGLPSTLNAGLKLAKGSYCVQLDADNRLHPDFVSRTLEAIQGAQDPKVAFVYTQQRFFGERNALTSRPAYDVNRLKLRNFIDACALVRSDIGRQFPFDPAPLVCKVPDYDFFLTLAEHGFTGVLLDEALVDYRVHSTSMGQKIGRRHEQVAIMKALLHKHHNFFSATERRAALREARNRLALSIICDRHPDRPLALRLRDLATLTGAFPGAAQIWNQARYTCNPRLFAGNGS